MKMPELRAYLLSAERPDEAQRQRLERYLTNKYNREVKLFWQEDKEITDGFRIRIDRIDSQYFDWTAEGKLQQLKDAISSLPLSDQPVIPLLRQAIEGWKPVARAEETGAVIRVADGIAYVDGLEDAAYGEILLFEGGIRGMVQELQE